MSLYLSFIYLMNNTAANNKRIAKNTLLLYFRMLLTMAVTLYTSRVVLDTLGVEDYGIYNVVGGVVAMFSVISNSLSGAISRFITYELGRGNEERLKTIFSSAVLIQCGMALLICILAEIGGVWFLNNKMNIPIERLDAANWVLQCSILTFMLNLISVPYNAAIIAHEQMRAFAYISILEVTLKLLVAFTLYIVTWDKLQIYAILLFVAALIIRIVYGRYCKRHFEECTFHYAYDNKLLKEMFSFAGWNFIGSASSVLRSQGVNIVLNLFCGPAVNAARGIAFQVNTAVSSFVNNFMTALNPPIIKSYASGDREYMMTLIFKGARYSFYLLLFLSLPIILEADCILSIWLKEVPEHTANFVRLVLIFALSESISGPLITTMLATGKIRNYQIVVGGLQMMNFPISYVLLKIGMFPEITMIVAIVISQCCLVARLYMLRKMVFLPAIKFIRNVYVNIMSVSILSSIVPMIFHQKEISIGTSVIVILLSLTCSLFVIFYIGCNKEERIFARNKAKYFLNKIR